MKKSGLYLMLMLCAWMSCTDRVTQKELIEDALILKINQYRITQRVNCRERAMSKAEAYVDSFLLANSLNSNLDTIAKPPKPMKPPKPTFKEKPDSLEIQ